MHGWRGQRQKQSGVIIVVAVLAAILLLNIVKHPLKTPESPSTVSPANLEAIRKESYDLGYANGYETAREENKTAYQQGYEAAQDEIESGVFTRNAVLGFLLGFCFSSGTLIAFKRREFALYLKKLRKQYVLRRTFKTIPANLSPEIAAIAEQIARSYLIILEQLRNGHGHFVSQYAKQWRAKLEELMRKAVRLMELIEELEAARETIDQKQLARTIRSLQRAVQNPNSDDSTKNAAVKSLRRAKQTHRDLLKTQKNLERCTASLQGITGVLDSLHLKISNVKVNTRETGQLEELSCDLEEEMSALEEALQELMI